MIKKIMLAAMLLLGFSALNAKNKTPFFTEKAPGNYYVDESLLEKIVAEKDFREFYMRNVEFANKLLETKSGKLFQKYLQKSITEDEKFLLFKNLGLNDMKEFEGISINLRDLAIIFVNKFPTLKDMPEQQQKDLLVSAFKRLQNDNSIAPKLFRFRTITPEDCFWWWMACNTACVISCSSTQGNTCYWECGGICAGMYGLCWLWSE